MAEREPDLKTVIGILMKDCEDVEDVASTLSSFFDPQVIDQEEQDEIVDIGIERVIALTKSDYKSAKRDLLEKLSKVILKGKTIN